AAPQAAPTPAAGPDFERVILPIFEDNCTSCHAAADPESDLVLETYEDVMRGGEHGAVITPGNSDKSKLVMMVEGRAKPKMPPKKTLPADALAAIKAWIDAGAVAPAASAAS